MPHSWIEADDDLMEWDYGAYEGRRTVDIEVERPGWRLFRDGCPGGETLDSIGARADRVVGRIRAYGGNVLLFGNAASVAVASHSTSVSKVKCCADQLRSPPQADVPGPGGE